MDPQTTSRIHPRLRHEHTYTKLNYKQAVLATLAYFDVFQYPLTAEEATRFLYKLEPDLHHVKMTLDESRLVTKRGSYYQLNHDSDHIATRHDREIIAKQLWTRVNRFRWAFNLTPYVRLVAVCNNLSLNNTGPTSDIDLLIITEPGRLFLSRLILTFWLQLFGVRRHGKKVAGRFCLSFFAAKGALQAERIEKKPHDLYLAYWLQTLEPVAGSRQVYENVLQDNRAWLQTFFQSPPHYNMHRFKETPRSAAFLKKLQEKALNTRWGQKIENRLSSWQLNRARTKQAALNLEETDIILSEDILKFHNIDKRNEIYQQWVEKLSVLLNHS